MCDEILEAVRLVVCFRNQEISLFDYRILRIVRVQNTPETPFLYIVYALFTLTQIHFLH